MNLTIEDVLAEWETDKNLDQAHIDNEIAKLSPLHFKYMKMYMEASKFQIQTKKRISKLKHLKIQYYKGMMDRDTLNKLGWEQYQGLKPQNANDWDLTLKNDNDLIDLQDVADTNEALLKMLESILWHIRDRGNHLKTLFDYQRFIGGVY
jgi:hypothetical protein